VEILVVLVSLLVVSTAFLPSWPYARWGYYPSGAFGLVALLIVALVIAGRL
jgi:hypothetical protein